MNNYELIAILEYNNGRKLRYFQDEEKVYRVGDNSIESYPYWDVDILTTDLPAFKIVYLDKDVAKFYLSDDAEDWINDQTRNKIREYMAA